MNWYKRAQNFDMSEISQRQHWEQKNWIGHYGYESDFSQEEGNMSSPLRQSQGFSLWIADRTGGSFERKDFEMNGKFEAPDYYKDPENRDELNHEEFWGERVDSSFHGRYDKRINTVSIYPAYIESREEFLRKGDIPGRLIRSLQHNYGDNVKIAFIGF